MLDVDVRDRILHACNRLESLASEATPGPWEVGSRYMQATCKYDNGTRCSLCSVGQPLLWSGLSYSVPSHVHELAETYGHDLVSAGTVPIGAPVSSPSYEGAGIESLADARYIAAVSPDFLQALVGYVREQVAEHTRSDGCFCDACGHSALACPSLISLDRLTASIRA